MAPARHGERHWDRPDSADAVDGGAYLPPPMCQSWLMGTYLLHGSDEVLLSTAVSDKIRELVGEGDRSLMLEEFVEDYVMGAVIESANTPPFFTERRVVVVHQLETTTADDIDALSNYIRDEADFTDLVVVWHTGKILKALTDAVKAAGGRSIDVRPQNLKAKDWLEDQVAITGLNLNADAMELLVEWLGEDVGRFEGLARTLASTYGATVITAGKLDPFLGERGDAKAWDLTDAIDGGNATKALMVARRMMTAGERHPLQIMAQLHTHFARLAKLDGPSPQSVNDVMALLNVKSYPAEKALKAYRNLGSAGVRRAFELLAAADRDLRGGTGLENDVVMDVLVARLAKLTSPRGGRR
ncbi:MAG: DNA polymerase III subunit delta [Actinobacteria bacterium]|nr:DNA polymerase III subunit delta [Actinomycetota bacterium]